MVQTFLKPHNLDLEVKKDLVAAALYMEKTEKTENKENLTLKELIDRSYKGNLLASRVIQLLADKSNYCKDLTIADSAIVNDKLYYRDRLHVPNYHALCLYFCCLHYNSPYIGHLGVDYTYQQLHQNYYWLNM